MRIVYFGLKSVPVRDAVIHEKIVYKCRAGSSELYMVTVRAYFFRQNY